MATALNKGKNVGRWYENALCTMENACSKFLYFPVDMKGIKKFEKKWPICINVYGYSVVIYPLHLSANMGSSQFSTVNLLLYKEHYYLICNMSSLVDPQCKKNKRKCYVCSSCLFNFVSRGSMTLTFGCARGMGHSMFSKKFIL